MLFEYLVASLLPRTSQVIAAFAVSARSTTSAVHTSPKMKWQSRSFQARWAEQISGLTTSAARAEPVLTALIACSSAKVAEEQATFMSKA